MEARYPKACRVSRAELWDQRPTPGDADRDPRLTMRFVTDRAFFSFVERRCGWDLTGLEQRLPPPTLRIAAVDSNAAPKPRIIIQDQDDKGLIGWFNRTFGAGNPPRQ